MSTIELEKTLFMYEITPLVIYRNGIPNVLETVVALPLNPISHIGL